MTADRLFTGIQEHLKQGKKLLQISRPVISKEASK